MHIESPSSCFKALSDEFKIYTKNVIKNAQILSERLSNKGFKIFRWNRHTSVLLDLNHLKLLEKTHKPHWEELI